MFPTHPWFYPNHQCWALDNRDATLWLCFQTTVLLALFLYSLRLLHLDTETLTFLLRCRVVVVGKLTNCRVPRTGSQLDLYKNDRMTLAKLLILFQISTTWTIPISNYLIFFILSVSLFLSFFLSFFASTLSILSYSVSFLNIWPVDSCWL